MRRSEAMKPGRPARDLRPAPQAAVVRRRPDPLLERRKRGGRQDFRRGPIARPPIAERFGAAFVVAVDQQAYPPRRKRQHRRDLPIS
jgi:hypothetical protein